MSKLANLFSICLFAVIAMLSVGCSESQSPEPAQTPLDAIPSEQQTSSKKAATSSVPESSPKTETNQSGQIPATQPKTVKELVAQAKPKTSTAYPEVPNFTEFAAGSPRKEAFFKFMAPLIQQANAEILDKRQRLKALIAADSIAKNDQAWLKNQADTYGVDRFDPNNPVDLKSLLTRMDAIPTALALAQGANESAWGTSRFARKAHNYFGQWCFSKGCGLVPKQRNDGASHEVRSFDHPYESAVSYLHNLNTHRTYKKLREIRAKTRQKGQSPTGLEMAEGLVNYSARKHEYVKELQSMIRYNKLVQYN